MEKSVIEIRTTWEKSFPEYKEVFHKYFRDGWYDEETYNAARNTILKMNLSPDINYNLNIADFGYMVYELSGTKYIN